MNEYVKDKAMFGSLHDGRFQCIRMENARETNHLEVQCIDAAAASVTIECVEVVAFKLRTNFFWDLSIMAATVYTGPIESILADPGTASRVHGCTEAILPDWLAQNPHVSILYVEAFGSDLVVVSSLADKKAAFRLVEKGKT